MAKKKGFTLNEKTKKIYANISELDSVEKEIVQMYINAGYILYPRANRGTWTKKAIDAYIQKETGEKRDKDGKAENPEGKLAKFDSFEKWTEARTWFFKEFPQAKKTVKEEK